MALWAADAVPSGAAQEAEPPAKTPAQWVEGLVYEMAAAKDVADARVRAANELRSFEQTVMRASGKVRPCGLMCLASSGLVALRGGLRLLPCFVQAKQAEILGLQSKVGELQRENHVLKRAVAIQQTRLQEAAAANKQQAAQAQEAISQLQVHFTSSCRCR